MHGDRRGNEPWSRSGTQGRSLAYHTPALAWPYGLGSALDYGRPDCTGPPRARTAAAGRAMGKRGPGACLRADGRLGDAGAVNDFWDARSIDYFSFFAT